MGNLTSKRILMGIMALTMTLAITGCGSQATIAGMGLQPSDLTESETNIVALLRQADGQVSQMYDYSVDDSVQSVIFTTYKLDENGKWVTRFGPSSFALQATTGRIVILFDNIDDGMKIAMQDNTGTVGSQIDPGQKSNLSDMDQVSSFADTVDIEYDKDIPLAMQVFSSEGMASAEVDGFYHPEELLENGYEGVFVVVVKFSKAVLQ